jgi:hypothetical protein
VKTLSKADLVAFLYLLMRDSAPTGEIVRVVRMLKLGENEDVLYTSPELKAYAERLAAEMLERAV